MGVIAKLMLLFTLMPILEISLLVPLHGAIGDWATIGLVCCTALLGTFLTKWQGGAALRNIKDTFKAGKLPGEEILDGVLVLLAGATLITPGVITDTVGLLLLVPSIRKPIRGYVKKRFSKWLSSKATPIGHSYSRPPEPQSAGTGADAPEQKVESAYNDGDHLGQPDELL